MRSLNKNNKVEDVVEFIQNLNIDVVVMAETRHDPESIGISKLAEPGS